MNRSSQTDVPPSFEEFSNWLQSQSTNNEQRAKVDMVIEGLKRSMWSCRQELFEAIRGNAPLNSWTVGTMLMKDFREINLPVAVQSVLNRPPVMDEGPEMSTQRSRRSVVVEPNPPSTVQQRPIASRPIILQPSVVIDRTVVKTYLETVEKRNQRVQKPRAENKTGCRRNKRIVNVSSEFNNHSKLKTKFHPKVGRGKKLSDPDYQPNIGAKRGKGVKKRTLGSDTDGTTSMDDEHQPSTSQALQEEMRKASEDAAKMPPPKKNSATFGFGPKYKSKEFLSTTEDSDDSSDSEFSCKLTDKKKRTSVYKTVHEDESDSDASSDMRHTGHDFDVVSDGELEVQVPANKIALNSNFDEVSSGESDVEDSKNMNCVEIQEKPKNLPNKPQMVLTEFDFLGVGGGNKSVNYAKTGQRKGNCSKQSHIDNRKQVGTINFENVSDGEEPVAAVKLPGKPGFGETTKRFDAIHFEDISDGESLIQGYSASSALPDQSFGIAIKPTKQSYLQPPTMEASNGFNQSKISTTLIPTVRHHHKRSSKFIREAVANGIQPTERAPPRRRILNKYQKVHKPTNIRPRGTGPLKCRICNDRFYQQRNLDRHMRTAIKHNRIHVKCSKCETICESERGLAQHFLMHQYPNRKFPCTHCKRVFRDKQSLDTHLKTVNK